MKALLITLGLTLSLAVQAQNYSTGLNFDEKAYQAAPKAMVPMMGADALPARVDLSVNMPPIGNQGKQGSCVAWAVAYALKSYQEKLEEKKPFTSGTQLDQQRVFSPSFIYNQINRGQDKGSKIWEALEFVRKNELK